MIKIEVNGPMVKQEAQGNNRELIRDMMLVITSLRATAKKMGESELMALQILGEGALRGSYDSSIIGCADLRKEMRNDFMDFLKSYTNNNSDAYASYGAGEGVEEDE